MITVEFDAKTIIQIIIRLRRRIICWNSLLVSYRKIPARVLFTGSVLGHGVSHSPAALSRTRRGRERSALRVTRSRHFHRVSSHRSPVRTETRSFDKRLARFPVLGDSCMKTIFPLFFIGFCPKIVSDIFGFSQSEN